MLSSLGSRAASPLEPFLQLEYLWAASQQFLDVASRHEEALRSTQHRGVGGGGGGGLLGVPTAGKMPTDTGGCIAANWPRAEEEGERVAMIDVPAQFRREIWSLHLGIAAGLDRRRKLACPTIRPSIANANPSGEQEQGHTLGAHTATYNPQPAARLRSFSPPIRTLPLSVLASHAPSAHIPHAPATVKGKPEGKKAPYRLVSLQLCL
ncbi:hypothetical protein DFH27DRAFT_641024 [Peziza echinospora]|nr:hypothetical protein DFH27DRAFT_641024 [Peziza echinospora]